MSGIKNTFQGFMNASLGRGYHTNKSVSGYKRKGREKAAQIEKDEMFASAAGDMPDPEALRMKARRAAARRKGSRANTILTEQDTLG